VLNIFVKKKEKRDRTESDVEELKGNAYCPESTWTGSEVWLKGSKRAVKNPASLLGERGGRGGQGG